MLLAYSRPACTTPVIVGTGASFITPADALFNGRPADTTRVQWLSGAQTTSSVVLIQTTWTTPITAGLVGIVGFNPVGLSSAAGIKIVFTGKRSGDSGFPYALGGNSADVDTYTRSDGATLALAQCTATTPIIGLQMAIYNDQGGSANIAAGGYVDLGDLWVSPAFDATIDGDWDLSYTEGGRGKTAPESINGQPWPVQYPPARTLTATRSVLTFDDAFSADGGNPSFESLRTLCGNGQVSIQIPRYQDSAGALDVARMHATAIFGLSAFGKMDRKPGDYFSLRWTHREIPALGA